jgi:hypothetical protein
VAVLCQAAIKWIPGDEKSEQKAGPENDASVSDLD